MANRKARWRWLILILVLIAAGVVVRWDRERSVPTIPTVKVERQEIHTGVVTNGKAEPIEYRDVRAEVEGQVGEVPLHEGDEVRGGQQLLKIAQRQIASEAEHARADLADAEEAMRLLKQGGTTLDLRQLQTQIDLAKREKDVAAKSVAENERLLEKGAIARMELQLSRDRLAKAESDLTVLELKQNHRYDPGELARAEAAVGASRAALNLVQSRERSLSVVSPIGGRSYAIAVRQGDFVRPGDLLLRVGDFRRIRLRVYVDEPDLGKISKGLPIQVTWDGLPARQWQGTVDRLPSEIKELGTRKVGEVTCLLDNPQFELLPNMNLNVEIIIDAHRNVPTIPREALFGSGTGSFVYLVQNGTIVKRTVQTGISNVTRVEIVQGLNEGDPVTVDSETLLHEGMRVRVAN